MYIIYSWSTNHQDTKEKFSFNVCGAFQNISAIHYLYANVENNIMDVSGQVCNSTYFCLLSHIVYLKQLIFASEIVQGLMYLLALKLLEKDPDKMRTILTELKLSLFIILLDFLVGS